VEEEFSSREGEGKGAPTSSTKGIEHFGIDFLFFLDFRLQFQYFMYILRHRFSIQYFFKPISFLLSTSNRLE